jgi:galactose mutarotase-like enzyme
VRTEEHGLPIHGLLAASRLWSVREHSADGVRAALDFDAPELLDAFPFPHTLEVDARLAPDRLTVRTTLRATGRVRVPVAFGYHPYFTLPGVAREQWEVSLPVRRRVLLDDRGLPSGATERVEPFAGRIGDRAWDDGFDELVPGEPFTVAGGGRRIEVALGEGYSVAQVFAPPGQALVSFEPMTAPTNALVSGDGLRTVAPGDSATAEFSVRVVPT